MMEFDWLHYALFAMLFVHGIGWLLMLIFFWRLADDLSSSEMEISTLVREFRKYHGLVGTETNISIVETCKR